MDKYVGVNNCDCAVHMDYNSLFNLMCLDVCSDIKNSCDHDLNDNLDLSP